MLQSFFEQSPLGLLEQVAKFGEIRQQVLAGNIANVDTPGYRTRDLPVSEFQRALQQAVTQRQNSLPASAASSPVPRPQTTEEHFPADLFRAAEASPRNLTFHDENNRSIESELMEMTKNNMMQKFAVELMRSQMNMLETVINERL